MDPYIDPFPYSSSHRAAWGHKQRLSCCKDFPAKTFLRLATRWFCAIFKLAVPISAPKVNWVLDADPCD
jgi:hypothetical protein